MDLRLGHVYNILDVEIKGYWVIMKLSGRYFRYLLFVFASLSCICPPRVVAETVVSVVLSHNEAPYATREMSVNIDFRQAGARVDNFAYTQEVFAKEGLSGSDDLRNRHSFDLPKGDYGLVISITPDYTDGYENKFKLTAPLHDAEKVKKIVFYANLIWQDGKLVELELKNAIMFLRSRGAQKFFQVWCRDQVEISSEARKLSKKQRQYQGESAESHKGADEDQPGMSRTIADASSV